MRFKMMTEEEYIEIGVAIAAHDGEKANELLTKFIHREIDESISDELFDMYCDGTMDMTEE